MSPGARTPSAAAVSVLTPSLNRTTLTPIPAVPTSVSPTPQKDGRVLGLFDLLSAGTPSRSTTAISVTAIPAVTSSKRRSPPTTARFATTTQPTLFQASPSAAKTTTITTPFKTPSKPTRSSTTPSNTNTTPSFLRRRTITSTTATTAITLSRVDEQDEDVNKNHDNDTTSGEWIKRLPRKLLGGGLGRSLSSVVAGLRKLEEEAFGDEEEVMREMEREMEMEMGGGEGGGERVSSNEDVAPAKKAVEVVGGEKDEVEVRAGQVPPLGLGGDKERGRDGKVLLSGFDDEALYDAPDEEKQRGQPLRLFKKRGQKRTTRLSNMRPTRAKRPAQALAAEHDLDEEEQEDVVPETQFNPSALAPIDADELRLSDLDSDIDFDASASDEEEGTVKAKQKKKKTVANKGAENAKGEGVVKRAVRKVKATAHANFKRLKLKNTGSKGGPGHNSRFRRRR